jgi:integrase
MKRSEISFSLPRGVRPKHGAFYLVEPLKLDGKWLYRWHRLCKISDGEAALYTALGIAKAPPPVGNFADTITEFKKHYLPERVLTTRREAERMLDIISTGFSDFNVNEPDAADVIDFCDQFKHARSAARHYKALLSTFFRWAISRRLRKDNPCAEVWLAKPTRKKMIWTPEVFHKIRAALLTHDSGGHELNAGVMLQCYLDLSFLLYQRATEIRLLERAQISADHIRFFPTKTRGSSAIELDVEITPEIRAVLDRAAAASKRMKVVCRFVIHTGGGTAFTRSGIYSAFIRAGQRVGIEGINPKSLRSFAATAAKQLGYSLEELQAGLGHTTIGTTEKYIRKNEIRRSNVRLKLPKSG